LVVSFGSFRQSSVSRPEQAAARTDWRKRLRSAGTFASRCRAAVAFASTASTFAAIRFCSASGGSRTGSSPSLSKLTRGN
jgi:hypothetical protein